MQRSGQHIFFFRRVIHAIGYLLLSCASLAQSPVAKQNAIDSMQQRLKALPAADTSRYGLIYRLAVRTRYLKPEYTIELLTENLPAAQKHKGDQYLALYKELVGDAYWHIGKYDSSISNYSAALDVYVKQHNLPLQADILACIGYVQMEKGDFMPAQNKLLQAHELAQKSSAKEQLVAATSYLAILYERMDNWTKALEMHRQSEKYYRETGNEYNLAQVISNIGLSHMNTGNPDSARIYLTQAAEIFKKLNVKKGLANVFLNLSEIEMKNGNFEQSLRNVQEAMKHYEEIHDDGGIGMSWFQSGEILYRKKDYASARKAFEKSYARIKASGNAYRLRLSLQRLGSCCYYTNDLKSAWSYQREYIQLNDSLYSIETAKAVNELGEKYEARLRTAEIEKLKQSRILDQKEIERQNMQKMAFAAGLGAVLLLALVLYRSFRNSQRQKQTIEKQKVEVDMAYLQLHEKNKEVMDSIHYARRIQRALIASENYIEKTLERMRREKK